MQDTETLQQILRRLYHQYFDMPQPAPADLEAWARVEQIGVDVLRQMCAVLRESGLIHEGSGEFFCRLSAKGVFYVEDLGLAPEAVATHHFVVRLALLDSLGHLPDHAIGALDWQTLADRAGLGQVDCRRNLTVLLDAGWARKNDAGRYEITQKGRETLWQWRKDMGAHGCGERPQEEAG